MTELFTNHNGEKEELVMKKIIWQFPLVIFLVAFIVACSGGGGGGGTPASGGSGEITYSGLTTQAQLSAATSNAIFSIAWDGGSTLGTSTSSTGAAKALPSGSTKVDRLALLAMRLGKKCPINFTDGTRVAKTVQHAVPVNESIPGMASGTLTMAGAIDDTTGTGVIDVNFTNYNDGDGYTHNGNATLLIAAYDISMGVMTDWTMRCSLLNIKSVTSDVSFSGSIMMQKNGSSQHETLTINVDGRDNLGKETFRFENYVVQEGYDNRTSLITVTETYSGRVYVERFGYVDISTAAPLSYSDPAGNPNGGGPLIFVGAGNSKAFITPYLYGVKIETDINGDTAIEATNRYFWGNLAGPAFISLTVAPATSSVPAGLTQHFTASGTFSDSSSKDMTSIVTWTSSDTSIAEISSREGTYSWCWDFGCAKGWGLGSSTITASLGDVAGSATMQVSPAVIVSLDVHPLNSAESPSMSIGTTRQYEAVGTFSTNYRDDVTSSVTWSSSDNSIATISNVSGSNGKASSISAGTTTITATSGTISGSTPLLVSAWTLQNSGISSDLNRVMWAGSQFVAAGANGTILTSSDGKTFQLRSTGTSTALYDVARSGNIFVAVGAGGTILTSSDGAAWIPQASVTINDLYGVVWSGSKFVAVGANGSVLTSLNGTTWVLQVSGTANSLHGVAWSGGKFVAVGGNGTILTSPDGTAWTLQTSDTLNPLGRVVWSGLQFVAVSGSPIDNYYSYAYPIHISTDGINWSSVPIVPSSSSTLPPPIIWTSSDVIWCGTQFVVVGADGNIFTSGNGVNWSSLVSGTRSFLSTVGCSANQYVVAGRGGLIITSP